MLLSRKLYAVSRVRFINVDSFNVLLHIKSVVATKGSYWETIKASVLTEYTNESMSMYITVNT